MVYVNSKKFACESCIKGHRSSACHHLDRPLYEIKKKGRPVSQCDRCRQLRQSKKLHSKCLCTSQTDSIPEGQRIASSTSKSRRYIPIVPALPNGLRDVLVGSHISPSLAADSRQRVDSLLNPCTCKSLWGCRCQSLERCSSPQPPQVAEIAESPANNLRNSCCGGPTPSSDLPPPNNMVSYQNARCLQPSPTTTAQKISNTSSLDSVHSSVFELPPIKSASSSTSSLTASVPEFGFMPPISIITSIAGSGCTCGVQCACPGCVEHRGPEKASKHRKSCAEGCGTCVDYSAGASLPFTESTDGSKTSFLDLFFARAAALPLPPIGTGPSASPEGVKLPKLKCCGGHCGCSPGGCSCGKTCDGGCSETRSFNALQSSTIPLPLLPKKRSCCSG